MAAIPPSAQVSLTTLPEEILILIFISAPTIQTAARLSSVNRRLREVWVSSNSLIIQGVLMPRVPGYSDAVAFAQMEAWYTLPEDDVIRQTQDSTGVPSHLWLPYLLRNAEFASIVYEGVKTNSESQQSHGTAFHLFPTSYYSVRKLVLACQFDRHLLLPTLRSELEAASTDIITSQADICSYMCGVMSAREAIRQGLTKDWTLVGGEPSPPGLADHWEEANGTLQNIFWGRVQQEDS